jgi:uncharacterized membrane protein YidH (DUF202 family)
MNRKIALCAALIAAFAFTTQSANAGGRHHHINKKIVATAIVVGAASTAAYFAINNWSWNGWNNGSGLTRLGAYGVTSLGCAVVSPMVATVVLNRALTQREGHILIGSCVLPLVGGWLVNEAYNAHPDWDPAGDKQMRMHHRKHHAKM